MKRTRIEFKDIKAGDLLEVMAIDAGVKSVLTGIAFEREDDYVSGYATWRTSLGGEVIFETDDDAIYRVDVTEDKFEDIRAGDKVRVTYMDEDDEKIVIGRAKFLETSDRPVFEYWITKRGNTLSVKGRDEKIEILERADA